MEKYFCKPAVIQDQNICRGKSLERTLNHFVQTTDNITETIDILQSKIEITVLVLTYMQSICRDLINQIVNSF